MRMELPGPVKEAMDRLEKAGFAAYAVGGCVRDWALGIKPHDYDVCTAATPDEMKRVFAGERLIETGVRHGTLTVLMSGEPIEITAFRVDGDYQDGRHPDSVRFTRRVEDDLSRRDFTVNAMAYSPARGLVDPFGGQADCKKGLIRCVGDPAERFAEDSLRILRALRFSARLCFPIEENTAAALHAGKAGLRRISRERIAAELNGLLLGKEPGRLIAAYQDVLSVALAGQDETGDPRVLLDGEQWILAARRVDACPRDLAVRWAALLLEVHTPCTASSILSGLKQPTVLIEQSAVLVQSFGLCGRVELPEALMRLGPEKLEKLLQLEEADQTARRPDQAEDIRRAFAERQKDLQALLDRDACYSIRQLAVNGRDLLALGYQGKQVGQMLDALLLQVVRGQASNDRDALLSIARAARSERE